MKAFGDSITTGFNVSQGYVMRLASSRAMEIDNMAVNGSQALDVATAVYGNSSGQAIVMVGTNDHRIYGTDATKRGYYNKALQSVIAWMALPSKISAQQAAITGQWDANAALYGGALGRRSWTSGSTLSAMVSGKTVYVGYTIQESISGTFNVLVDGVVKANVSTNGNGVTTYRGLAFGPQLIRISGLTDTAHTVQVNVTSNGYPGGLVYIDWIAGSQQASNDVYVSNVIRMGSAGYASNPGTSDTNVANYNSDISARLSEFTTDGIAVHTVDSASTINPATDLQLDGIHPTDEGHIKIRDGFNAVMPPLTTFETYQLGGTLTLVRNSSGSIVSFSFS